MKFAVMAVAFLAVALAKSYAGGVTTIPPEHQIILKPSSPTGQALTWTPSAKQVKSSLIAIQAYLEKSTDESQITAVLGEKSKDVRLWNLEKIKQILANKKGYRVQFWGITKNGKNGIYCNFFPAVAKGYGTDDIFSRWRIEKIEVDDGGSSFWQVIYDPQTNSVLEFSCNG